MKRITITAAMLVLFLSVLFAGSTHQFAVLTTTDMHGRATDRDVSTQNEDSASMLRVATAVKSVRDVFGDDMIIIDTGDTIQGTLVAQYAINYKSDVENPMITLFKEIGYDTWTMGNHEFNFTPEQRNAQVLRALDAGLGVISANIVLKEDGVNVFGEAAKAGEPFYQPYYVKVIEFEDGHSVRVAVIGLSNPANYTWDLETNYANLQFSSLENTDEKLEYEIEKWVSIVKEKENPDIIILSAHTGRGIEGEFILENQVVTGLMNSSGVDLVTYGHDHTRNIETVKNAEGEDVYIVNGGGTAVIENIFTVNFDDGGNVADFTISASEIMLSDVEDDEELSALMEPWFDETYAWASMPLGSFTGGWDEVKGEAEGKTDAQMVCSQTALIDFIHKAQIWATWQNYESNGIEGATVSIASAVFGRNSEGKLSFVPSDGDTISTLELSKLYRYSNNLLCAIEMTGSELFAWMSAVADMFSVVDGEVVLVGNVFGADTFYGVDYTFDLSKPEGSRLAFATINGVDIREIDSIRIALNSYRLSGGYGFYEATGHTEADCFWTASQYLGSDRAPVPTQLGEYVSYMKTVTPDDPVSHGYDSTWSIIF